MADIQYLAPLFGISVYPSAQKVQLALSLTQIAEELTSYYQELRLDTFLFWPVGDEETQVRLFAEEVVPALREAVSKG